jgi:DNA polymerase III sliding clamp (beta) subunit (PCNA family)
MLAELRFVQGSVAKKDFLPALTHFVIEEGTVRGFNGMLALCSPIPFDIACKPKADMLVRAIANCEETVSLSMTPAGRLNIKSGRFKALIDCAQGETPHVQPEGTITEINGARLLEAMKALEPFVGDDATRPWSNGVLLRGQSAYATNNVALVEYWLQTDFPVVVNIPRAAVKEIVRIKEVPLHAQLDERSFTLHYSGGRWIRTQLLDTVWPDLKRILDVASIQEAIQPELFTGLCSVKPFVDKFGRIYFRDGAIHTHDNESEGSSFELEGATQGVFNVEILQLLEGVADTIDWSTYPKPCVFYGKEGHLRGAVIGMRQ